MRRFIESFVGGIFSACFGGLAGLALGGLAAVAYYVARLFLSMQPFVGSTSREMMSSISDTMSFAFWSVLIGGTVGAVLGFLNAFNEISRRRRPLKDFMPR